MTGFHSCSFCWMQSKTDMGNGELCWAPYHPSRLKTLFRIWFERLVDPAQPLMLNPCHGWDELNKILYGFEYWDLLKTFQAYGFYPFWLFHTLTNFQSHIHSSLHFPLLGKLGRESCQLCATKFFHPVFTFCILQLVFLHLTTLFADVQCIWTGGSASCLVLIMIQHLWLLLVPGLANKLQWQTVGFCLGVQMFCSSYTETQLSGTKSAFTI